MSHEKRLENQIKEEYRHEVTIWHTVDTMGIKGKIFICLFQMDDEKESFGIAVLNESDNEVIITESGDFTQQLFQILQKGPNTKTNITDFKEFYTPKFDGLNEENKMIVTSNNRKFQFFFSGLAYNREKLYIASLQLPLGDQTLEFKGPRGKDIVIEENPIFICIMPDTDTPQKLRLPLN